jgi:prepilin-type N-terminal cleavage/methylation domain-containing protein
VRNTRNGFTIIELLAVIAIIGILATLALPRYALLRQRAIVASMKTDLKNLATSQEGFFSTYQDYAAGTALIEAPGPGGGGRVVFRASPSNTVVVTRHDGPKGVGWSATVTNPGVTDAATDVCGVFAGDPSFSPNAAVTAAHAPDCY